MIPPMLRDGYEVVDRFVRDGRVFGVAIEPERLLELAGSASKFSRDDFDPGHFTASAVLVDAETRRLFLVRHPKLHRWLQPGGHIEVSDGSIAEAAAREAREETGFEIDSDKAVPVALEVHRIPASGPEPAHLHLDLRFQFRVQGGVGGPEGELPGRWFDLDSDEAKGALGATLARVRELLPGGGRTMSTLDRERRVR